MDEIRDKSEETDLEAKIKENKQSSAGKIAVVDTVGNITYSLIVGSLLDYIAGLNFTGIVASRASATVMNSVTGGIYGWWREKTFKLTKTTEKSGNLRKRLVDLLAFNTFQVPIYSVAIAIGSYVSEGKVDMEKVKNGATYLATISSLIGPTMGWYMDCFRKLFGVNSAAEGAYRGSKTQPHD
ncbi:L-alanine exporter AlaE [Candidatus Woesearchaeota archaeon]|nr:L-alanine exporter AlaE [Candidatus Woesearchaeota archaeon]